MKLFECANGKLINPELVACCYSGSLENKYFARFQFTDNHDATVLFDRATYAEGEIKAFRRHCEEI